MLKNKRLNVTITLASHEDRGWGSTPIIDHEVRVGINSDQIVGIAMGSSLSGGGVVHGQARRTNLSYDFGGDIGIAIVPISESYYSMEMVLKKLRDAGYAYNPEAADQRQAENASILDPTASIQGPQEIKALPFNFG